MADDDTTTEETEAPKSEDAAGEGEAQAQAEAEPRVTVPDFGEQLQAAVQSKLGELGLKVGEDGKIDTSNVSADNIKAGAQMVTGLMGQMLGALQQAAKTSGVDVQVKPLAGTTPSSEGGDDETPRETLGDALGDDNVIDLAAERDKREPHQPSALENRLVTNLKSAFFGYVRENAEVKPDADTGEDTANFNNDFIKNHAGKLMGTMFQAFAGSLLPTQFEFGGKSAAAAEGEEAVDGADGAESAEGDEATDDAGAKPADDLKVKMNLDLAGLFGQLFQAPQAPADAGEAAEAPQGAEAEDDDADA